MRNFKRMISAVLVLLVCVIAVTSVSQGTAKAEIVSTYDYYIFNNNGTTSEFAIPKVYTVKTTIRQFDDENATFSSPEDMFIRNDRIFVCDTKNNRIVKLDSSGKFLLSASYIGCKACTEKAKIEAAKTPEEKAAEEERIKELKKKNEYVEPELCPICREPEKNNAGEIIGYKEISRSLSGPVGIYVDDDEDIYIADTGNERIVHLDSEGYFVEQFKKPDDKSLESYPFDVTKIYISNRGVIYLLLKTDFQGLMMLNPDGSYIGNTGMTWTTSNLLSFIWSKLNPEAEKIERFMLSAPPYSNFMIDDNGWIYATVTATDEKQISKLNSTGTNVYGTSGDTQNTKFGRDIHQLTDTENYSSAAHYQSNFVDIAVDDNGIVYALDNTLGNIFLYDQTGNNIAFFGEAGSNRGKFKTPVSINLFSDGSVAVLDKGTGYITVFQDTEFCRLMKEGVTHFFEAEYSDAREVYQELLKLDINYIYAHKAIAKSYFKEEDYKMAMTEYQLAKDVEGYSASFEKYKSAITKKYFFLIFGIVVCAGILIFMGIKRLKKYADKIHVKVTTWGGDL